MLLGHASTRFYRTGLGRSLTLSPKYDLLIFHTLFGTGKELTAWGTVGVSEEDCIKYPSLVLRFRNLGSKVCSE